MTLAKEKVAQIVKEFGKDEKDTGCPEVQVAILTERIKQLTEHLKVNKHDYSSKRALFILVGQRRGLLNYIDSNDHEKYVALVTKLGLRK